LVVVKDGIAGPDDGAGPVVSSSRTWPVLSGTDQALDGQFDEDAYDVQRAELAGIPANPHLENATDGPARSAMAGYLIDAARAWRAMPPLAHDQLSRQLFASLMENT
jgi:hypothetical protein